MFNMSRKIRVEHKKIYTKHNIDSITKNQKGFTLVEMLVTLVVLGILLSISVGGLIAWQDWARFNKVNEYAETMFLSAQNQLTEYSESGRLKDFGERVAKQEAMLTAPDTMIVKLDGLVIDKQGNTYDLDKVWNINQNVLPEEIIPDDEKHKYRSTVYSARCNEGDYSLFISGADTTSETAWIVFELLGSYVYDTSLLDAAICVEFTVSDGQVFSVSYCDVSETVFTYDYSQAINDKAGTLNIATREEFYRKDRMIGYYGVDTLSKATSSTTKKPIISSARLNNEETLNLSFKITSVPSAAQKLSYSIDIVDTMDDDEKDNDRTVLNMTLDGTKIRNFENRQEISCPIRRYTYDAAGNADIKTLGDFDVLAWIEDDRTIRIVLDAVDVQAMTYSYEEYITTLNRQNKDNENNAGLTYVDYIDEAAGFPNSYSFHRFAVGAENIYCIIQGSGSGYKPTAKRETSNKENAYFAKGTYTVSNDVDEDTGIQFKNDIFNYSITNARHLYNMRFVEDFSCIKLNELNEHVANNSIKVDFTLDDDIDWKLFAEEGNVFDTSTDNVAVVNDALFPSIKQLRYDDSFTSDKDCVISGLNISEENNVNRFVYDIKDKDGNLLDEVKGPTGLFVQNIGHISGLTLDDIMVTGTDMVGAFCGKNAGIIENLETKNTNGNSLIKGDINVGGILGYQVGVIENKNSSDTSNTNSDIESANLIKLDGLVNHAKVTGEKYVGGVLGMAKIPEKVNIKLEINKCKNFGVVEASKEKKESMYIGGIVGFCQNLYDENENVSLEEHTKRIRVVECESSPRYSAENLNKIFDDIINGKADGNAQTLFDDKINGVYVGGIVGYNYFGSIENCKTVSEIKNRSYVFGYQYVGGIVGYNQGPLNGIVNGSDDNKGVNGANVVGYKYVGGITGCNADIDESGVGMALESNDIGKIPEPSDVSNLNVKVSDWINKGIVYAADSYAGGICGYNAGWLFNCKSETESDLADGFMQETFTGDYAGGIAGYNCGVIGNTKRTVDKEDSSKSVVNFDEASTENKISSVCYVAGNNFVGGIVGYNDEDGIIEDYELSGGLVKSEKGDFVGGYAGFNSSVGLLQDEQGNARSIISNPDEVTGKYFVGGVIGGNIINTHKHFPDEESGGEDPGDEDPGDEEPGDEDPGDEEPQPGLEDLVATLRCDTWDEQGLFYANLIINLKNNTGHDITNWKVKIDMPQSVPDISYINEWNCKVDSINDRTIQLSSADWNKIIYKDQEFEVGINAVKTSSKEARDAIVKSILTAYGDIVVNNYKGASKAELPYYAELILEADEYSEYYRVAKYSLNVENRTGNDLKDWKVQIDLPPGGSMVGCWNGAYTLDSETGKLIITEPGGNFNMVVPAGSVENPGKLLPIVFQISYYDLSIFPTLPSCRIRLYTGDDPDPVYDSGEEEPDEPDVPDDEDDPTDVPDIPDAKYRLNAGFNGNNFNGEVNGKAFVGGFMGYNLFVDSDSEQCIDVLQQKLLNDADLPEGDLTASVDALNNLRNNTDYKDAVSKVEFYIEGQSTEENNSSGVISGDLYVAGVMGYNDSDTRLYIDKVVNNNSIVANKSVKNDKEQENREDGKNKAYDGETDYTYSYSGGITGKVNANVTINMCKNTASNMISTKGTYTGGICEINDGRIISCEVSNIGTESMDYVGGICGLNKASYPRGVFDCNILDKSIAGRNYVGGVAAENFGYIRAGVSIKTNISATGIEFLGYDKNGTATGKVFEGVAGGTAAYNHGIIEFYDNPITKGYIKDITITSNGDYVGGVTGINYGRIINKKTDGKLVINGSITGRSCVGGIIGENRDEAARKIANYCNEAAITSTSGKAGGVIGSNKSNSRIYRCDNRNIVTATTNGEAGGITSYNEGRIEECNNYAKVSSPYGYCAGIAVTNGNENNIKASIIGCNVIGNESERLSFESNHLVGGIVSTNYGKISKCSVSYSDLINLTDEFATNIGAIAGENYGTIQLDEGTVVLQCTAKTYSSGSNVGGVAGINHESGIISGQSWYETASLPSTAINCDISFASEDKLVAAFGGIAGKNSGVIKDCAVKANITGASGSKDTGYGGIAGVQGSTSDKNGNAASITNCTYDGVLYAEGTFENAARMGGITGVNGYNTTVEGCRISVFSNTKTKLLSGNEKDAYSYLGGIAGINYGKVISCDNYDEYNKKSISYPVDIIAYQGMLGGIVGCNEVDGEVLGTSNRCTSTGKDWYIESKAACNDNGQGGIIGYNASGRDISYVYNYAKLTNLNSGNSNASLGGIIGRSENKNISTMKIENAINYGNIEGTTRAAGICAMAKYSGISYYNCLNYGNLSAISVVAGIQGTFSDIPEYNVMFVNCQNHGDLSAGNKAEQTFIGGIISRFEGNPNNMTTRYVNCVNTGNINYGYNQASAFGGIVGESNGKVSLDSCRNYGTGNIYGLVGNGDSEIYNSTDFSGTGLCPLGKDNTVRGYNNYYVNASSNSNGNNTSNVLANYGSQLFVSVNNNLYSLYLPNTAKAMNNLQYNPASGSYYSDKNDYNNSYYRIPTYREIESKYMEFIYSNYYAEGKLSAPDKLLRKNNIGVYQYSWEPVDDAYSYEVRYKVVKGDQVIYSRGYYGNNEADFIAANIDNEASDPIYVSGRQFYEIKYDNSWKDSDIIFEVRAIEGRQPQYGKTDNASDWVINTEASIQELNAPNVHLELVGDEDVIAVLDNYEDYRNIDCTVEVWINDSKKFTFNPMDKYSKMSQDIGGETDNNYSHVYAKVIVNESDTGKYADSVIVGTELVVFGSSDMRENSNAYSIDLESAKFYGSTIDDLSYQMNIETDRDYYIMSDFIAYDETVNTSISHAHRKSHITRVKSENVKLSDLPAEVLGQDINIMTYLWASQGDAICYGHIVGENVTAGELENLTDYNFYKETDADSHCFELEPQSIWITDEAGERVLFDVVDESGNVIRSEYKLKPGYIIYSEGDNKYSVLFNAPLAYSYDAHASDNKITNSQIKELAYKFNKEKMGYLSSDGTYIPIQVEPKIGDIDISGNKYSFEWDTKEVLASYNLEYDSSNYKDALYSLNLIGETVEDENGNTKQLDLGYAKDWNEFTKEFNDEEGNWNYPKLIFNVVSVGAADGNGVTTKLPSCATKEFSVKIPFTRIPAVNLELMKDENNSVSKNNLRYNVIWNAVPEKERSDLGGYLITVTSVDDNPTRTHYYYEEVSGDENKDVLMRDIDLSDFSTGENVEITIRAIAKTAKNGGEESVNYKDGMLSPATRLTIPTRLDTPSADILDAEYDGESIPDVVSLEDFNNKGISLSIDTTELGDSSTGYQIAMAVYDDYYVVDSDNNVDISDTSRIIGGMWNKDAYETLIDKTSPATIDGPRSEGSVFTYRFGEEKSWADYSGKWLKVAVRSISDNSISSWWSDEDAEACDTINYKWIKLPMVKLDAPITGNVEKDCDNYIQYYDFETGELSDTVKSDYVISNKMINIKMPEYADSLEVQVVSNSNLGEGFVHWYYIEKDEEEKACYNVYAVLANDDVADEVSMCKTNKYANIYLGKIASGENLSNLSYEFDFDNVDFSKECKLSAKLLCTDKDEFSLVLPDVNGVSITGEDGITDTKEKYIYTDSVCVKAFSSDEADAYIDSCVGNYRRAVIDGRSQDTVEIIDALDAPQVKIINHSNVHGKERINFVSNYEGNYVCHFVVTDTDGNLVASKYCLEDARYLSIDNSNEAWGSVSFDKALFDKDLFDGNYNIKVMFAVIENGKGISSWCQCEIK